MSLSFSGHGVIAGLAVGGLPDGTVDEDTLANNAVGSGKLASGVGGKVLQAVWTNTSTVTSTNTVFGWDDTLPQRSEGTEILSQSFTPQSASSNILIQAKINYGLSVNARAYTEMEHINLQWYLASGNTDVRTYSARVGTSGTSYYIRVNTGGETTHRFSTANNSNMLITEIA